MRPFPLAVVLLAACVATAGAAPGDLDPGFGKNGRVTTLFESGDARANGMAIQPDGKIVVAGSIDRASESRFALVRYRRNGALDPSFGSKGAVETSFGSQAQAAAIALQPGGKIVVAGSAGSEIALARYQRNGSLDTSFGAGGKVTTSLGAGRMAVALSVAIQDDGRIVVAGSDIGGLSEASFALVRYDADGSPDESFGEGGRVRTAFVGEGAIAGGVVVQPDGRILVAGYRFTASGFVGAFLGFTLARYESDGSPDASFGSGGRLTTTFGSGGLAAAVALQKDGRIIAAGSTAAEFTDAGPAEGDFALARYRPDGSVDSSFGSAGKVVTNLGPGLSFAQAVALRPDGRIITAGFDELSFALAAYTPRGTLDRRFGDRGIVRTKFGAGALAHAVAVQPDGKVVAAGEGASRVRRIEFVLARYLNTQVVCRAPRVIGKPVSKARRVIRGSHCSVGRVSRAFSARVARGRIVSQHPTPGTRRAAGAKVDLVVSKGSRKRR
jgi:uncharacterized delta-60 repeat protein